MYSMALSHVLALSFFVLQFNIPSVHASLYVINPSSGSTCQASKPCTVQWLDDGTEPLLSDIGVCTVGLYTGQEQLVQTISPVDVSSSHSLNFTPDPKAGPNSNTYYIAFTSTTLKANGSEPYQQFSPAFRLTSMTGSFATPISSDTATRPLPSSLLQPLNTSSTTSISTVSDKHPTSTSTSTSGTPTTPLVFPTPTGTVSSDSNHNSARTITHTSPLTTTIRLFASLFVIQALLLLSGVGSWIIC